MAELPRVWSCSHFVAQVCCCHPEWFAELLDSGDLGQCYVPAHYTLGLAAQLETCDDEDQLLRALRLFRRREMVRIVWRDLARLVDLSGTTMDLSRLADACIDGSLAWHHARLIGQYGSPLGDRSKREQRLVVLAMGKLGAMELNLSSDIDLIFAYAEAGVTDSPRSISNQEFFTRLAQALIRALDSRDAEGFVFRVDMRLRPYGDSGALALSFDAMEEYYQDQGRDWERYAMIKARICAGDQVRGVELLALLRPFTYRRYLDFSAIDSLRKMKAMISREVQRLGKSQDIKLGAGGIREIEFIAQSFQLIRGGRDLELQQASLVKTLDSIAALKLMPAPAIAELREAYEFLRNTEHALQAWADEQTQRLPEQDPARLRLAYAMGYSNWEVYSNQLTRHRDHVRHHFAELIRTDEEQNESAQGMSSGWQLFWASEIDDDLSADRLRGAGFEQAEQSLNQLRSLRQSPRAQLMQTIGRERLDALMPKFLGALCRTDDPSLSLQRTLPLIEAVIRRSAYLVLLDENPAALAQLLQLCAASPMIARQLTQHPALLDELLDGRALYTLPDREQLRGELRQQMLRSDAADLEEQMEGLRYFRLAQALRVAACELTGILLLMKVSDYLTFLAEAILEHVLSICRDQMVGRYGSVPGHIGNEDDNEFLILAYGKMGGIEMSHGSGPRPGVCA